MIPLPDFLKQFYLAYAHWGELMVLANKTMDERLETTQKQQVFNRTALSQICPSCCYRPVHSGRDEGSESEMASDSDQMLILVTDGNFQHRRLKMARLKGRAYNRLSTPMFVREIEGVYDADWDLYKGGLTGCGNTFTAANKPTTFRHYEETGLLGISCR
jgi:hypothetical protein